MCMIPSYFDGVEISYLGEAVAIYGTVRLGWDIGKQMAEEKGQYPEYAIGEGCDVYRLPH